MLEHQKRGRKAKPDHIRVNRTLHVNTVRKLEQLVDELRANPKVKNVSQSAIIDWLVNRTQRRTILEQYEHYDKKVRELREAKPDLTGDNQL